MKLKVNGVEQTLDVDPEMPLLWALRDVLGLTGTKYGCGEALCGACTVHLDGEPVRACVTPIRRAAGRALTTIEGLSPTGEHPLQKAWVELGVPQCGFCQAGQIMSAAALAGVMTLGLWSTSSWQLLPRSRFLDELAAGPMPPDTELYTLAAARDWVVPLARTRADGPTPVTVPLGHSSLVVSEDVYRRVSSILRPTNP